MQKVRVLIIEKSNTTLQLLKSTLGRLPNIEIVATAKDVGSGRSMLMVTKPAVVIMDGSVSGAGGLGMLSEFQDMIPGLAVIILQADRDPNQTITSATPDRAAAFMHKPSTLSQASTDFVRQSIAPLVVRLGQRERVKADKQLVASE